MSCRACRPIRSLRRCRTQLCFYRRLSYPSSFHSDQNLTAIDSKAFSETLLLPKTPFPLWTDPSRSEFPFRTRTCEGLYRWQVSEPFHVRGRNISDLSYISSNSGKMHKEGCSCCTTVRLTQMEIYTWVRAFVFL